MLQLAFRSVKERPGRFAATLLSAFLGAGIVMMFNSLHDTAAQAGIDAQSEEILSTTGGVVGSYGTLLVFFAVASTLTVNVRQRGDEIHLLRCSGATPAQIKRMIMGEAAFVAVIATTLATLPAMLAGRLLVSSFKDSNQVADNVDYAFGSIALSTGTSITLLSSVGAAWLAVRRATSDPTTTAAKDAARARWRTIGGITALVLAAGAAATTFAIDETEPALMAPAAYAAVMTSIGFAVFSPHLLRALLAIYGRPIQLLAGVAGYLTVHNMRRRADQLAGILMPMILFTGVAIATLYMQLIASDALDANGVQKTADDKNLESLNLVIVGIIIAFACIMLINTLYAATSYRNREFGGQRLAGATPRQVQIMVAVESLVLTATGVTFGTLAGLVGILPYNIVRTDTTWPEQGPATWITVTALAATVTFLTSLGTTRRSLQTPAVDTITAAA
ncbi:FtsX-like permease family protein [Streptomyces phytohabitans]|uniref:FtsX-like permease family protein n=1 Tax=Streptomyces phytohabitans TaxID=1150371 RepID=UPI00345BF74F